MTQRLPFNKRQRHRLTQNGRGYRPTNNWGSGDLPAPWAEGDIVRLTGEPNDRVDEPYSELYVVTYVTSVDEGDAWYCRVGIPTEDEFPGRSSRLHVAYAARSSWDEDVDWMEPFELVDTADPEGLELRRRMLEDGWTYEAPSRCESCGQRVWRPLTTQETE